MSGRRYWSDLVLEAMKNLGTDVKPVALKDIYSAVERLVPLHVRHQQHVCDYLQRQDRGNNEEETLETLS